MVFRVLGFLVQKTMNFQHFSVFRNLPELIVGLREMRFPQEFQDGVESVW